MPKGNRNDTAPKITNAIKLEEIAVAWEKLGLHMTTRRYRQIAKDGRVAEPVQGYVDALKCLIQLCVYYQTLAEGSGSLSLTDERTRLTRINADRKQFELEKARGDAIDTAKAMKLWSVVMENIVKKIDQIPAKLPPLAHGLTIPEIKAITEQMTYEIRNEIANPNLAEIARMGSDKRTPKHVKAKTPAKRKRLGRSKPNAKPGGKRGARKVVHGKS